jgi:dolichol-phosphate mannosyltransferase
VVIPLLNEEDNLRELHKQLQAVAARIGCRYEIIFVDDGSTDTSSAIIRELAAADPHVHGIRFSRNFGHEAASTAGFDRARGDVVVLMDADLQDPPAIIEQMFALWQQGNEVIYAVRNQRHGETLFKRCTSWMFYRLLNALSDVPIPADTGDFRMIDARVLRALQRCREYDRFVRGLVAWTGFRSISVSYDRPARAGGQTKYNPLKLLLLSLDAAVGFSILPLRLATALGFTVTFVSLIMVAVVVIQKLFHEIPITGYALQTTAIFFLGGVQMLLLGILGEYIARIYRQSQDRPLYVVAESIGKGSPVAAEATESAGCAA